MPGGDVVAHCLPSVSQSHDLHHRALVLAVGRALPISGGQPLAGDGKSQIRAGCHCQGVLMRNLSSTAETFKGLPRRAVALVLAVVDGSS